MEKMGDLGWKSDGNKIDVRPPPSLPLHKGEEHTALHVIATLHLPKERLMPIYLATPSRPLPCEGEGRGGGRSPKGRY